MFWREKKLSITYFYSHVLSMVFSVIFWRTTSLLSQVFFLPWKRLRKIRRHIGWFILHCSTTQIFLFKLDGMKINPRWCVWMKAYFEVYAYQMDQTRHVISKTMNEELLFRLGQTEVSRYYLNSVFRRVHSTQRCVALANTTDQASQLPLMSSQMTSVRVISPSLLYQNLIFHLTS